MLKLLAEDAADLDIIAAAVQDALVRVGDVRFDAKSRRLTVVMNRFRWEKAGNVGPYERVRSVLSFEGVLAVRSRRVGRDMPEALVSILQIGFTPAAEPPGGTVSVTLAGGGELAIEVECLEARLMDFGAPWKTPRRPDHDSP